MYGSGLAMSRVNDTSLRTAMTVEGDLLKSFPESKAVEVQGGHLVMTAGDGNKYRLTERDKKVQLCVREGKGWKPVAELYGKAGNDFLWVETETNGTKKEISKGEAQTQKTLAVDNAVREQRQAEAALRDAHRSKDPEAIAVADEAFRRAQEKLGFLRNMNEDYFKYRAFSGLGGGK
jgi:hypothetical protein